MASNRSKHHQTYHALFAPLVQRLAKAHSEGQGSRMGITLPKAQAIETRARFYTWRKLLREWVEKRELQGVLASGLSAEAAPPAEYYALITLANRISVKTTEAPPQQIGGKVVPHMRLTFVFDLVAETLDGFQLEAPEGVVPRPKDLGRGGETALRILKEGEFAPAPTGADRAATEPTASTATSASEWTKTVTLGDYNITE